MEFGEMPLARWDKVKLSVTEPLVAFPPANIGSETAQSADPSSWITGRHLHMGDDALHVVCSRLFKKMFLLRNATILAAKVGLKFNPCISPSSRFEIEDPVQGFEELKNKQC
ncbi:predicted protein [Histoplasma capsulatum var. duboisii H88]|uniref:Predicted protein n=1 Tax=Ajellomyces capsulatus (strain H88) TaxID=544711 RepID=F0UII0_AJEC8|nr:predicted protein [Histoplasma capsulatum var. duboisii H88]